MECCCSFLPGVFGDNQPDLLKIVGDVILNSEKLWAYKENEIKQMYYKIKGVQDDLKQPEGRPDIEKQYIEDVQKFSDDYRNLENSVQRWKEETAKCEKERVRMLRTIDGSLKNLNLAILKRLNESHKTKKEVMKDIGSLREKLINFQTKVFQINSEIERQLELFRRETAKENPLIEKRLDIARRRMMADNEMTHLTKSMEQLDSQIKKKEFEIDTQMLEIDINIRLHEANRFRTKGPNLMEVEKFFKELENLHDRLQKEYVELESEGKALCEEFKKMLEHAGSKSTTSLGLKTL